MLYTKDMDIESAVKNLMNNNRRKVGDYQFTAPASDIYPFQWLWDSCFHAIILSHFDIVSAKKELEAVLAHPLPSGLLPHMSYWHTNGEVLPNWGREERGNLINATWKAEGTSSISQPPLIALAVLRVYEVDYDIEFLHKVYPALYRYFAYLQKERTFNSDSLLYIINPDESGEDNSPRFDGTLGLPPKHTANESLDKRIELMEKNTECDFEAKICMSKHFGIADVSFNVIYVEALQAMAKITLKLGLILESAKYTQQANIVQGDILSLLRYKDLFLSYNHVNKKHIQVLTWNIFMPLYGGLLTQEEARTLVDTYLRSPNFFKSDFGVTTTAKNEPAYDASDGFWRGPIWLAPHWFIFKGLKRYGFDAEAAELKEATIRVIEKSGLREHYHPDTGQGLGAVDFTWGGLVLDMN